MNLIITIVTIGIIACAAAKEQEFQTKGSTVAIKQPDSILFAPPVLLATRDSTGFVQQKVNFFSAHGDSIRITRIEGSCKCAAASVQRPLAHDSVPGMFFVQINAKHFTDSLNFVDFTVTTEPPSQPTVFRAIIKLGNH